MKASYLFSWAESHRVACSVTLHGGEKSAIQVYLLLFNPDVTQKCPWNLSECYMLPDKIHLHHISQMNPKKKKKEMSYLETFFPDGVLNSPKSVSGWEWTGATLKTFTPRLSLWSTNQKKSHFPLPLLFLLQMDEDLWTFSPLLNLSEPISVSHIVNF